MNETELVYRIIADVSRLVSGMEKGKQSTERLTAEMIGLNAAGQLVNRTTGGYVSHARAREAMMGRLNALGIKTSRQLEEEIAELNTLIALHREDTFAVAQLSARKNQLNQQQQMVARGMGQMAAHGSRANFVLLNMGRISQDMAFGWIGVMNNIQITTEAMVMLTVTTGGATNAMKSLWAAMKGPAGLLFALSTLTGAFLIYEQRSMMAASRTKDVASALEEAADQAARLKGEMPIFEAQDLESAEKMAGYFEEQVTALEDQIKLMERSQRQIQMGMGAGGTIPVQLPAFMQFMLGGAPEGMEKRLELLQSMLKSWKEIVEQRKAEEAVAEANREAAKETGADVDEQAEDEKKIVTLLGDELDRRKELLRQTAEINGVNRERIGHLRWQNTLMERQLAIQNEILRAQHMPRRAGALGIATDSEGRPLSGISSILPSFGFFGPGGLLSRSGDGRSPLQQAQEAMREATENGLRPMADATVIEMQRMEAALDRGGAAWGLYIEQLSRGTLDLSGVIQSGITRAVTGISAAIGELAAGTGNILASTRKLIGEFTMQLGQTFIAYGTAGIAAQIFIRRPEAALAAGALLVGLGAALKAGAEKQMQSLTGRSSGGASSGGLVYAGSSGTEDVRRYRGSASFNQATQSMARLESVVADLSQTVTVLSKNGVEAKFVRREFANASADVEYRREITGVSR